MALLVLVAGVVLDLVTRNFWERNALLAGLLSSLIVVMLSAAVLNEAVERRKRRRWSVLAQYVMLELVRQARLVWTGVTQFAGLMAADATDAASIDAAASAVHDTQRLKDGIRQAIADGTKRRRLHERIAEFVVHGDEVLGRWAGVMLNADAYAEIIDRHVELATDVAWLGSLLDSSDPTGDSVRRRRSRIAGHPDRGRGRRRPTDRQDRDDRSARRGPRPDDARAGHAHRPRRLVGGAAGHDGRDPRAGDEAEIAG